MRRFWPSLLAFGLVILTLGPIGHYWQLSFGGPDLIVIALWALTWFFGLSAGWRFALTAGILIDLAMFSSFGIWTGILALQVLLLNWLRSRVLAISSLTHALLALLSSSLAVIGIAALIYQGFALTNSVVVIVANLGLGVLVYYVIATQGRLFQRWAGRRLG